MATAPSSAVIQWGVQSPLACFLAGVLVPSIAYFFLAHRGGKSGNPNIDIGDWDDSDDDSQPPLLNGNNPSASWGIIDAPYKMVLCVNTSLSMGKGT